MKISGDFSEQYLFGLEKIAVMSAALIFIDRFLHNLAYWAPGGNTIRPQLHRLRGAKIGKNVWISQFVYIDKLHPEGIFIGDNCTIGFRSSIFTHLYWGPRKQREYSNVVIERDVYIGPHCLILPGVRIGERSVIKGGSVVSREVPAGVFWGSPPSGPIGIITVPLTSGHTYEEFVAGLRPMKASP